MDARDAYNSLRSRLSEADTVAPSTIGGQFYCEKKVELEREHGEVETPAKAQGTETHETAAEDAVEVAMDEVWDAIERGERQVLLESPFVGEAADFVVVGIPDAVVFDEGNPQLVFDRKTTSIPDRLFTNQRIQVWLYAYMLDSLGFETDDLQIAILTHDRAIAPDVGKHLQKIVLAETWTDGEYILMEDPKAILHVFHYDPIAHLDDLDWALEYWREEREAKPTTNAAKCRSCEFRDVCPDAQV